MVLIAFVMGAVALALCPQKPAYLSHLLYWITAIAVVMILSCFDLLLIRLKRGKAAWEKRQAWTETHWIPAIFTALLLSPVALGLSIPTIMQEDVQNEIIVTWYGQLGTLAGIGFFFFLSIFRDQPSRLRGILAYGCLAVFISNVFLLYHF